MSTGQTLLSIAFFVLLTVAVINANRLILDSDENFYRDEALVQASQFATALMNEVGTKEFDANVVYTRYQGNWEFTAPASLGPNSSEAAAVGPLPDKYPYKSIAAYTDVDDYNGYQRSANSSLLPGFLLTVKVYYVRENSPDVDAGTQTRFKRVDVTVTNSRYMPKSATFSTIITY